MFGGSHLSCLKKALKVEMGCRALLNLVIARSREGFCFYKRALIFERLIPSINKI